MEETKETQDILNKENLCLIFAWDPKDSKWTAEKYKEACLKVKMSCTQNLGHKIGGAVFL